MLRRYNAVYRAADSFHGGLFWVGHMMQEAGRRVSWPIKRWAIRKNSEALDRLRHQSEDKS